MHKKENDEDNSNKEKGGKAEGQVKKEEYEKEKDEIILNKIITKLQSDNSKVIMNNFPLFNVSINYRGKEINLLEDKIKFLILKCRKMIFDLPVFLEIQLPINVVDDIHGEYTDLLPLF